MAVVIYNCKRCKVGKRVEYSESVKHSLGYGRYESRPYRLAADGSRISPGRDWALDGRPTGDALCDRCGRFMDWGLLRGYRAPHVPCDARCINARGFDCQCSCAGEHHGSGWGFVGLVADAGE